MVSAYIRQLELDRLANLAAEVPPDPPEKALKERFEAWFFSLPAPTRNRPFSMAEFERALGTRGRYLSPVLIALGWHRRRIWSTRQHYHRYWQPPAAEQTP